MNQAVWYLILATSIYSIINVGVKFLGHLPVSELVFFRALMTLLISGYLAKKKGLSLKGNNRWGLFLRGLLGTVALISLFLCVQNMPLAVAMTLFGLVPILTILVAHFYVGEKASPMQWVFFIISFLGVILVRGGVDAFMGFFSEGSVAPVPWSWMALGLFSALMAALTYTVVRQLRLTEDPMVVIFYFPLVTLPLITPVTAFQWVTPQGYEWLILLGMGVLTQIAQWFMTLAYQMEKAADVVIFNYTGLFWGILFGWILFQEKLSATQIFGVLLVFFCLCGNYYVSKRQNSVQTQRL